MTVLVDTVPPRPAGTTITNPVAESLRALAGWFRLHRRFHRMRARRRDLILYRRLADADERVQRDIGLDPQRLRRYDWLADLMRQ